LFCLAFLELDLEVSEFFLEPGLEAWGEVQMLGVGFDLHTNMRGLKKYTESVWLRLRLR
jgi:hypothetical protein